MKKHNFSAGPCILPQEVFKEAAQGILDFQNSGLSILEISHRSPAFVSVIEEARSLALQLLELENKGYQALFLHGGASMQFLMTAYNFLNKKAGYLNTGTWSSKAIKEAKLFGEVLEVASSKDKNFNYIPKNYEVAKDLDYFHCTSNNTIFGTQIKDFPKPEASLFCDMSSDIFSREMDFSNFDLIYAGAQKNMGPAGTTLVVIKESLLEKVEREIPSILSYKVHLEKDSMFNTPAVYAVYVSLLTLRWIKNNGGIKAMESRNTEKAELLYKEIDRNPLFKGFAAVEDRSAMNATFKLLDEGKKEAFDKIWKAAGINGLNGHRSVGGYRASMYNALSIESVEILVSCMQKLEEKK